MDSKARSISSVLLLQFVFCCLLIPSKCTTDTITRFQGISDGQTLISAGQTFELGFFNPGNSNKQYLGIWYNNIPVRRIVWVANRENPLPATDSVSSLIIGSDGNLKLEDSNRNTVWSTQEASIKSNTTIAVLSDDGNFVLQDSLSGLTLWESFNYLSDTFFQGMRIGTDKRTGEEIKLSSWRGKDDPSPGDFVFGLSPDVPPQAYIWKGRRPYWRTGPWDGEKFIGLPGSRQGYGSGLNVITNSQQGSVYLTYNTLNVSYVTATVLSPEGSLEIVIWKNETNDWLVVWAAPENPCDRYGICGPFGVCKNHSSPICECFKGFSPMSNENWSKRNWTDGCVRRTELSCQKNISRISSEREKADGFRKLRGMKLPDRFEYFYPQDIYGCRSQCLSNCSCEAYSYVAGIGCLIWTGDLMDSQQFSFSGNDLFLRLAYSELGKDVRKEQIIVSFTSILGVILLGTVMYGFFRWRTKQKLKRKNKIDGFDMASKMDTPKDNAQDYHRKKQIVQPEQSELPLIAFRKILIATNNFSINNKLGEGGFGPVYKGILEGGHEVAVKRLSSHSGQGVNEFKNEIMLISKLQHRNLVRLLGCCIDGEEKLLVYEYLKNRSLDTFLFDAKKKEELDWATRFRIIQGIARGLLYLHCDSSLRVIHRDLKASNILLDNDMNPKISDFGLARMFSATRELVNTQRVVGTLGYMSPEYAMGGLFSEKSDVFSFGVLLLEIVTGTRNTSFHYNDKHLNLLGYAWQLWREGNDEDLLDAALSDSCLKAEARKCIHIGLLCVQEQAADRPTMYDVVFMLGNEADLPHPMQPAFSTQSMLDNYLPQSQYNDRFSINDVTTSIVEGR